MVRAATPGEDGGDGRGRAGAVTGGVTRGHARGHRQQARPRPAGEREQGRHGEQGAEHQHDGASRDRVVAAGVLCTVQTRKSPPPRRPSPPASEGQTRFSRWRDALAAHDSDDVEPARGAATGCRAAVDGTDHGARHDDRHRRPTGCLKLPIRVPGWVGTPDGNGRAGAADSERGAGEAAAAPEHQRLGEHRPPQLSGLGAVAGGQREGAALAGRADRERRPDQQGRDDEQHDAADDGESARAVSLVERGLDPDLGGELAVSAAGRAARRRTEHRRARSR